MSQINVGRVLVGGLVAGLVINVSEYILNMVVLQTDMNAAMARLSLPPFGNQAIAVFVVLGFVLGIAAIWLYAAIRPRFSAGPKTALFAGATVWFFAYLYPGIGMMAMGLFTTRLMVISLAWGLGELLVASLIGAAPYKE
jgi:hypothetical protein